MRRLLAELRPYKREKNTNFNINPKNGDLSILEVTIFGPDDSPYKNGKFIVEIHISKDYPLDFHGPKVYFITKIYHPNFRGGGQRLSCCNLSILNDWSPANTILSLVKEIYDLIKTPRPYPREYCPHLNQECAILMTNNFEKYKEIATKWTKEYAT